MTAGGETYEAGANTSSELGLDDTEDLLYGVLYGHSKSKFTRKENVDADADVDDADDDDAPSADFKISGNFCRLGF